MRLSSQKQTLMNIAERVRSAGLYLITGLDCRPEYWTGLMEWITGSTFQLNLLTSLVCRLGNHWTGHMSIVASTVAYHTAEEVGS